MKNICFAQYWLSKKVYRRKIGRMFAKLSGFWRWKFVKLMYPFYFFYYFLVWPFKICYAYPFRHSISCQKTFSEWKSAGCKQSYRDLKAKIRKINVSFLFFIIVWCGHSKAVTPILLRIVLAVQNRFQNENRLGVSKVIEIWRRKFVKKTYPFYFLLFIIFLVGH